ncbi:unnamed protein product [Chilo suppressalis]|uniref:PDZ domain-containing protein n=1 Tax=Chilo suppressalis TaxID=168631 RepID=A0ABN8ECT2_CHISP|nr:unnamed protein product [Chilo suppressalis]
MYVLFGETAVCGKTSLNRVNKSDVEDKSLSNDESPLPSCPRQPPDGVETPSDAMEKVPELPTRLPPRLPAGWPNSRSRYSYTSRTQDARSEASVKDKIAMFSSSRATSTDHLDKCGTLPTRTTSNTRKSTAPYSSNYPHVSTLDRRLTKSQDNLDETPRSYKKHTDRPEVPGAHENATSILGMTRSNKSLHSESKPFFYGSTTTLPSTVDTFSPPIYHMRSISDDSSSTTSTASTHKSNLEYLIEQRKKSMSKLKCLAIPEAQGPIIDLPEIKVQDTLTKSFLLKSNQSNVNPKDTKLNNTKATILKENKWKANLLPNNIPKYSPAFKRKSLQVYTPSSLSKESTPERRFNEKIDAFSKVMTYSAKPMRTSLDTSYEMERSSATLPAKSSLSNMNSVNKKEYKDIMNYVKDYKNIEIKLCTATDVIDSDNDSAMSSTQSSYRSSASSPMHTLDTIESDGPRLSPRISHFTSYSHMKADIPTKSSIIEKNCEEYKKRHVYRSVSSDTNVSLSSSAGSAATSGSQASCSSLESSVADSDKKKVSKTYNIDSINRRNILASAKCRSGRDAKLKSPVVETKFLHESNDRSPSPTDKPSDRLSTLTSSVSAVSNKGENRRRTKIIAESDSDSDCDVNVRQRKTDFKNTRLKRNSSSANKIKSNETEDAPKCISEKIIKEIKKAGLDNFSNNTTTKILDGNKVEPMLTERKVINKEEIIKKIILPEKKVNSKAPVILNDSIIINEEKLSLNIHKIDICKDIVDSMKTEEIEIPTHTIRLKKGAGTGVGLILAGGVDCEAKDVTVHRVLADSVADKAGLKRGAKVRSINGCTMTGLTHAQSVTILKEQRLEVIIEIENDIQDNAGGVGCGSENAESKVRQEVDATEERSKNVVTVVLDKAGGGAGLGFGLDGGRDSPHGDRPLTIKKLFAGGAAAQSGRVLVGAELLSAGGQSMEGFTRTQAWAALKALPVGPVALVLRNSKH